MSSGSWGFTKWLEGIREVWNELNPATLTGAVDVIVVEQPNGDLLCTPFHVRFGKMGVLRSREKVVEMSVNDVTVPIQMILSDGGEAFFVEHVERVDEMTYFGSPVVTNSKKHVDLNAKSNPQGVNTSTGKNATAADTSFLDADTTQDLVDEVIEEDSQTPVNTPIKEAGNVASNSCDTNDQEIDAAADITPTATVQDGCGQLDVVEGGDEPKDTNENGEHIMTNGEIEVKEEEVDTPAPLSPPVPPPLSSESELCRKVLDEVQLSVCGGMSDDREGGVPSDEQFNAHLVNYEQFDSTSTDLLSNPDLVVRINGKYYNWRVGCPMLVSLASFERPLSQSAVDKLTRPAGGHDARDLTRKDNLTAATSSVSSYFWWRRATSADPPSKVPDIAEPSSQERPVDLQLPAEEEDERAALRPETARSDSQLDDEDRFEFDDRGALSDSELEETRKSAMRARYKTTLLLTSDQLKSLNLQRGVPNKARFSVTTKYQGTCDAECEIWLWRYSDKIIISDIDGTITKSDVLGHIIPRVGVGHWAHIGVAELFNRIAANDYKIVYLTARAIGLSYQTKEYLRSVRQDKFSLPGGPLLLSPTSVFNALHREIIEKKPEIFKTSCLREVSSTFPANSNPFYGGFGNRTNDVVAYEAAGITPNRIYIIDPTGRVEFLDRRLEFSYQRISDLVDHLFPPLAHRAPIEKDTGPEAPMEFNAAQFWRNSVPDVEVDLSKFPKPTPPSRGVRSSVRSSSTSSSIGWSRRKY